MVSGNYLENVVLNENLVINDLASYKSSLTAFHKQLNKEKAQYKGNKVAQFGRKRHTLTSSRSI